jgi:hypothetical protein
MCTINQLRQTLAHLKNSYPTGFTEKIVLGVLLDIIKGVS